MFHIPYQAGWSKKAPEVITSFPNYASLCVLVHDAGLCLAGSRIKIPYEQGDLVVFIEVFPESGCEGIDISLQLHRLRLALVTRKGTTVAHIGVDEMALSRLRIAVIEGEAEAFLRIALVALQDA